MDIKKKLLITLFTLSATTILAILSLIFVLVDNPQGFTTNFDIMYKIPSNTISFNIQGVENTSDYSEISFKSTYTLQEPAIPKVHNKMLIDWYTDDTFITKAEFPLTVTESTTLYPYFKDGNVDSYIEWNAEGYYQVKRSGYTDVEGVTECVFPDYFDDGTNGLHPLTKFTYAMFNDTVTNLSDLYIGNNFVSIPYGFSYLHTNLTGLFIGRGVKEIGVNAFHSCTRLKSITIKNGVEVISSSAFLYCTYITNLTIPNSVISIGDMAFQNCFGLTSITLGSSLATIGRLVFYGCSGLTNIVVDSENTIYDNRNNCNAIIQTSTNTLIVGCKNTIVPNTVTSIGDSAFHSCGGLTSITIPDSVTSIGYYAFANCSGLANITMGPNLTSIGEFAFSYCSSLSSITIPSGVTSIANSAFDNCSGLKSVTISEGVTSIGDYAFNGCSSLSSITIPNTVTSIRDSAFEDCSNLSSITIPSSVTSIRHYAFRGCSKLTSLTFESPNGWTKAYNGAFTSNVTSSISLSSPTQNATWFVSTSGYYNYYWKRV